MKIYGYTLSDEQIAAGLAAMRGVFTWHPVSKALYQAGVPYEEQGRSGPLMQGSIRRRRLQIAAPAAAKLMQRERKAGRIKHLGSGKWERVDA